MSSRSLMRRISPFFAAGIRQHQRLLSSSSSSTSSSSAAAAAAAAADMPEPQSSSPSLSPSLDVVHITDNCVQKMKELQADEASGKGKLLRLSIEAGGCSGFQYTFSLDDKTNADDRIFERDGVKLVVDEISFDFVKGATVDYVEELIRSAFQVSTNPSAVGGCSCKSSFMVK